MNPTNEIALEQYYERAREISSSFSPHKSWWDKREDTRDRLFWGIVSELLIADILGTTVKTGAKAVDDGGFDGIINGKKYDVKTSTFFRDPQLKLHHTYRLRADIYILVSLDKERNTAKVIGYATSDEMKNAPSRDYGYGLTRFLTKEKLHPLEELCH